MLHELDSALFRDIATNGDVSSLFGTLNPQQGDNDKVLLAKIAASLSKLRNGQARAGVILDKGGYPRAVLNAFEDVAANETYEELVAQPVAKRICILGLFALSGSTATTIQLWSKIDAGSPVAAGPVMANAANGGEVLPLGGQPWLTLPVGAALGISTSNHAATGVIVVYFLEPNYLTDENGIVLTDENGVPLISP